MKELSAKKVLLCGTVILAAIVGCLIIYFGLWEIVNDQSVRNRKEPTIKFVVSYRTLNLVMMCACVILVLFHVLCVTRHILRDHRYTWVIGYHYFMYILWELISACVIFGMYNYLETAVVLLILVGVLFVLLFVFNLLASILFNEREAILKAIIELKEEEVAGPSKPLSDCYRVKLK